MAPIISQKFHQMPNHRGIHEADLVTSNTMVLGLLFVIPYNLQLFCSIVGRGREMNDAISDPILPSFRSIS